MVPPDALIIEFPSFFAVLNRIRNVTVPQHIHAGTPYAVSVPRILIAQEPRNRMVPCQIWPQDGNRTKRGEKCLATRLRGADILSTPAQLALDSKETIVLFHAFAS